MIIVQDRITGIHLASRDCKYTLCGKIFGPNDIINTLQTNCPIPGACAKCNHWFKIRLEYESKDLRY